MSRVRVNLELRTSQVYYLKSAAQREDTSYSGALTAIVERYRQHTTEAVVVPLSPRKVRQKVFIEDDVLAVLDSLAGKWGLSRSDVARRIIDEDKHLATPRVR